MNKQAKGKSVRRQENGRRVMQMFNTHMRPQAPLCGAVRRHDGQPCQQLAMKNGRCYYHGGATPKGDGWHRPKWPKGKAPDAIQKMNQKLVNLERAHKKRARLLERMTKDERAAYDKWLLEHPAGSAAQRTAGRLRRQWSAEARKSFETAQPRPISPEMERLEKKIAELEAEKLILERGSVFD